MQKRQKTSPETHRKQEFHLWDTLHSAISPHLTKLIQGRKPYSTRKGYDGYSRYEIDLQDIRDAFDMARDATVERFSEELAQRSEGATNCFLTYTEHGNYGRGSINIIREVPLTLAEMKKKEKARAGRQRAAETRAINARKKAEQELTKLLKKHPDLVHTISED